MANVRLHLPSCRRAGEGAWRARAVAVDLAAWLQLPGIQYHVPPCHWPDPGSDEVDIAEFLGSDYTDVNQQLHRTGSGDPGCHPSLTDASQNWHIYSLVWEVGRLQWLIDWSVTCTVTSNVPNTPMFLIMETAVGEAGGATDTSTPPATYLVDYVRISANADTLPTGPPPPPLSCASGSLIASTRLAISRDSDPPGDERLSAAAGRWQPRAALQIPQQTVSASRCRIKMAQRFSNAGPRRSGAELGSCGLACK